MLKWLETSGTVGVILQQQVVDVREPREHLLRKVLVAPCGGPNAAGTVAPADVHSFIVGTTLVWN